MEVKIYLSSNAIYSLEIDFDPSLLFEGENLDMQA